MLGQNHLFQLLTLLLTNPYPTLHEFLAIVPVTPNLCPLWLRLLLPVVAHNGGCSPSAALLRER